MKRTLMTFTICMVLALLVGAGLPIPQMIQSLLTTQGSIEVLEEKLEREEDDPDDKNSQQTLLMEQIRLSGKIQRVILERSFVCGTETVNLGGFTSEEAIALMNQHPGWTGQIASENKLMIQETVDDLSPHCKENAYMSMDKEGNLTLFDGKPKEDKAIRTFFQLDIESMETTLPAGVFEQLQDGIRVQNLEEYNSVISTFGDYAVAPVGKIVE